MITYGSTTLTSYNTITKIEVYYYKSTSATSLSGGSWSTTKPTWENGKYIWQKIRTTYEGKLENGLYYSESDPVNITGQQGATGTAAYSYKLNASDTTVTVSKIGVYSVNKITFTATSKQGTGSVNAYAGRFKIETTTNGTTWTTSYTSSGNESSKEFTIPTGIIAIRCSLYQANGTTTLLDIMTIPILSDDRPIATKTYTGLIGSANDAANASFYFAKIHPDNYTTNYKVKMKVRVTAPEAYAETIDIQFGGYGNTFSSFDAYTTRTGSIGIYYINLYRATQAGISTNHKGHALGIGLRSSTNPTSTSYKRTVIIDILELDGCTIEMLDTAVKYASIDGTGSTNYYGLTEMAVSTAGQNATNNTNTSYTQYANAVKAGTFGVKRYTLLMKDSENTWSSFINQANSTATTKTVCQGGFLLGKLLYSAGGAEYASGANTSTVYDAYPFDFRYSTNCGQTLISHQPVYLVGTIENDGLFYLNVSQWWTQTEPTYADGKVYIYVGMAYSSYQVWLSTENPAYIYYNGEFILYDKAQTLQNINTLKNSLETQIDGKVETWCQKINPASNWTAEERPNHTGDLWYYIGESGTTYKNNTTYQYNGSTNTWSAYSANPDLFDKIDGKTAIYYGTQSSVTSAEEGDYLVDSTDGSSYRWNNGAWVKVTDYKTAINNIQIGGRNLLRNTSITRTGVATKYGLFDILIPTYSSLYALDLDEGEYTLSFDWESSIELPVSFYAWIGYGDINGQGRAEMPQNIPAVYTGKDSTSGHYVRTFTWANANDTYPYFACRPFRTSVDNALNDIEFTIKNAKLEKGNKATDWTPAPEDVEESIRSYAQSIQSQVDGMAEIHYGTVVPTLSNAPYTSWEDTETKDMHVDDLYYNTSTGYCYRFIKSGSTYSWTRIKDSDITAAATAASNANTAAGNAQTTANNANTLAGQKRRIFVAQPTPPYEIGDLWVEGSNGDIKKCKTARASGSYTASDWELASKYTDDTLASEANDKIDNLEIGGRNLILDTATERISPASSNSSAYVAPVPMMSDYASGILNNQDDYFTYSFDYEVTGNEAPEAYIYVQIRGRTVPTASDGYYSYVLENPTGKHCCTFKLTEAQATGTYAGCGIRLKNATDGAVLRVWNVKLERGTRATDWTPAPEDAQASIDTALAQSVEYIIGTQTAATGNWAGKSSTLTELKDGTQIRYWLPYAGSGNATLNLTLKNGTATGAIPVYRQGGSASSTGVVTANRVTTHFPAGTSISMVYGVNRIVSAVYSGTTYTGTFTGWFADGAYDSGNTINRTRLQNVITAETAITAAHIICGTATGYKNIGAGINFDLSYPILYASSAIAATKTGDNNYLQINEINASNNGTIQSGATKKVLYLKGTVSGNIFTISASPFMTTATPTSADGFYYIPLGMMYSTTNIYFISSNRLYAYLDSAFQPVDTAAILRAAEAKKTATNYMSSDNTGIMVADLADGEQLPANATGGNVFITAGYGEGSSAVDAGVHIRDGQEDLAIYGETTRIGKENDSNVNIDNNGIIINKGSKELAKYFSKGITFDEEIPYKIGNDNSYITFEDTDSDNIADSLSIVADSIYFRDTANTNIKDTLNGLQSDLAIAQEDIDLKNNYIKINTSEPSIVISASSNTNDTNLKLESSQLSFQIDGQTTATITNDQMNIPTASVTNLFMQSTNTSTNTVYEKVWVMRTNGHLSLKTITRN